MKIYWVENNNNNRCFIIAKSEKDAITNTRSTFRKNGMSWKGVKVIHSRNFKQGDPIVIIFGVGMNWGFHTFF